MKFKLTKVSKGASGSLGGGVAVLNASHLQQFLGNRCGHDAGTAGGGDQTHPDGAALSSHLNK